ncbi:MAG: TraR/DksA C4-type zinc finger protein [Desulforegulaceae bacterium]|nr:TraR/DksA C4-type zinc finger protein [Desulforegulaceae bacterium]
MPENKIIILKKILKTQLEENLKVKKALKSITKPVEPDVSIGRLTRMEAIQSKSINDSALLKTEIKIKNIQAALRRIDSDPDFGYCDKCGEEINIKRLKIMPETRLCVKCMAKLGG